MESVDAKISRAGEHLETLTAEIYSFLQSAKRNTAVKVDGQHAWITWWLDDPHPPIRLSVLVGDLVFNLRSALDNLVCGLIRTADPGNKCRNTKFPIFVKAERWQKNWREDLQGVPAEAQPIIKSLQPCFREYG